MPLPLLTLAPLLMVPLFTTSSRFAVPLPVVSLATTTYSLFPYQEAGARRLISDKRCLLADEMGLGKSAQAISALNRLLLPDARSGAELQNRSVLIVCPKSVLNVWLDELDKFLDPRLGMDIQVATAGEAPKRSLDRRGTIQLINYDVCHKHRDLLQAIDLDAEVDRNDGGDIAGYAYDVVICDEAHYLKSPDAKRTVAVLGGGTGASPGIRSLYLWLLTGTPIMNRPIELYPFLRAIDPIIWGPMNTFIARYCDPKKRRSKNGRWSMDARGAANLGELSDRLKPYMIRRYKADVLSELPPKLRSCVNLDGSETEAAYQERQLVAEMMGAKGDDFEFEGDWRMDEEDLYSNLESFGAESAALISYLPDLKPSDFQDERILGRLAKIRKKTAMLKIKPAVQLLKDAILSHKVVVFAHHRQLVLALAEEFRKEAAHVIGGMNQEARATAVRRFQGDETCRLFVGSIRAAGVGLTLTAASHVVFLELDWSPASMAQAEDRCHRVGQKNCVQVQYYVFRDTIDEWIARQLVQKEIMVDMALRHYSTDDIVAHPEPTLRAVAYVMEFGKHKGVRIEDLPRDYLRFIIETDGGAVYKSRHALWKALARLGFVDPPPPRDEGTSARDDFSIANVDKGWKEGSGSGIKHVNARISEDVPRDSIVDHPYTSGLGRVSTKIEQNLASRDSAMEDTLNVASNLFGPRPLSRSSLDSNSLRTPTPTTNNLHLASSPSLGAPPSPFGPGSRFSTGIRTNTDYKEYCSSSTATAEDELDIHDKP